MAVEVKKIEYIEGDCLVASHLEGILKRREIGDSLAVLDDHFAVEDSLFDRESGDGICHEREPISPIETSASPYDRLALFKNGLQAIAVEFDLMHKARSGRWRGGRSRQTRRDKAADPGGARGFRKSDPERPKARGHAVAASTHQTRRTVWLVGHASICEPRGHRRCSRLACR
jgi:hypothetical protein